MNTFITDGSGNYLVQMDDDSQFGFSLADDYQAWAGGFGSGWRSWTAVAPEDVPEEERARLGFLL